jgi:taurine dioxygenase
VTPEVNPPAGSILRAETAPPYGGNTTFTSLVPAYEGLSGPLRRLVDGLRAEHRYQALYAGEGGASTFGDRIDANQLVAHHPVVRLHPETGERALFVNPPFTSHILELNPPRAAASSTCRSSGTPGPLTPSGSGGSQPGSIAF